jgi:hypothetical protein
MWNRKGIGQMSRASLLATQGILASNFEVPLTGYSATDDKTERRNEAYGQLVEAQAKLSELERAQREAEATGQRFQVDSAKGIDATKPKAGPSAKALEAQAAKVQALRRAVIELDAELCDLGEQHRAGLVAHAAEVMRPYVEAVGQAEADLRKAKAELEGAKAHRSIILDLASGRLHKPRRVKTFEQREAERQQETERQAEREAVREANKEKNRGRPRIWGVGS